MKMSDFIREHRDVIDNIIKNTTKDDGKLNDKKRKEWVLGDEGLCNLARQKGAIADDEICVTYNVTCTTHQAELE